MFLKQIPDELLVTIMSQISDNSLKKLSSCSSYLRDFIKENKEYIINEYYKLHTKVHQFYEYVSEGKLYDGHI